MTNTQAYAFRSLGIDGAMEWPDFGRIASRSYKAFVSAIAGSAAVYSSVSDSIFRAIEIRRTYEALANLDDHTLSDIGIRRDEIGAISVHSVDFPDVAYPRRAT